MTLNTLHLLAFNFKLKFLELSSKLVRSVCKAGASESDLIVVLKIFVSSAKVPMFEELTALNSSWSKNSNGPRIDPWGTPDVTGRDFDVVAKIVVH